jgi:2-dehydro-3-deoxyphosphogluconate aldolase/(4S)-4-hydroxy-2-oxoglutarate aldolase
MPWSRLMPTGGVSPEPENLKAWFDAGACCVGMGSQLFTKDRISSPDLQNLMLEIRKTLQIIKECRKK